MFNMTKRIMVVGDIMLDRYYDGQVDRISPEAPVPVLRISNIFDRAGGAANVAINVAKLGLNVTLVGYVGKDSSANELEVILRDAGVNFIPIKSEKKPTILKVRALARTQQMIRLDLEESFKTENHDYLIHQVLRNIQNFDALILSDYGKGTLACASDIIMACSRNGKPVFVDPKGADYSIYRGATLITPNLAEFSAVAGGFDGEQELEEKAQALRLELGLDYVLVTRGELGMSLVSANCQMYSVASEALEVFDVTGAGDTVIATLASAYASGLPIQEAVKLSNIAAGLVVGRIGTSSVTAEELLGHLKTSTSQDVTAPIDEVKAAARSGEVIVMTNGCFDILHAGHVTFLQNARALGDRLVVAINSDASVERLKGHGRPINSLDDRISILSCLRCVDWVIPFEGSVDENGVLQDTPLELINAIRPNILVKGADYTIDTVVGAADVLSWGGRVEIIDLVEGRSTTAIAEKLSAIAKEQTT